MAAVPARVRERGGGTRSGPAATRRRHTLAAWLCALPFLVLFAVFMVGPVVASLTMSFTDFTSRDLRDPLAINLVGLENYTRLLGDERFLRSAFNTAYFVAVGVPLTMGLALAVAVALNSGIQRFRTFFRVGFYIPVVTSIVAVAVVWRFILRPDSGLLNQVLGWVGINGPDWLQSTTGRCRR
jgi:multiple sugar transport system permease protein